MLIRSGPHQTNMGNRELRQMPTAVRRLGGQAEGSPRGVEDQSKSLTRAAMSPAELRGLARSINGSSGYDMAHASRDLRVPTPTRGMKLGSYLGSAAAVRGAK